ncbi:MAG: hypothetical protein ACO1QB_09295 [Verrucomicrobiales bacterium]
MLEPQTKNCADESNLSEALTWALTCDLVEGFATVPDDLNSRSSIGVRLTDRGKRWIMNVGNFKPGWWAAQLSVDGIEINLFARSAYVRYILVCTVRIHRQNRSLTLSRKEASGWRLVCIENSKNDLPDWILKEIKHIA